MGITIRDVAAAAGVSTATVSRALRGLPNVDEQTRLRVQATAAQLDYVISPSASRLASGRTGSVAVLMPYISRWFFSTVLSGIESVFQSAGMDLLLMSVGDPQARHPHASLGPRLRRRVDGVLVVSMRPDDPQLDDVLGLGLPTCLIGTQRPEVPAVRIDDVEAGRIATRHLINLGHRRIGVIAGTASYPTFTAESDRMQGFHEVMKDEGIALHPMLESYGHFTIAGGEQAMTGLLAARERPTAVFAMSDEMAFGAMRAMRRHGLVPGRDIALIGIDGHDMSEYLELTTVAQPVFGLGRLAAEALIDQIRRDGIGGGQAVVVPTHLIVRGSTTTA